MFPIGHHFYLAFQKKGSWHLIGHYYRPNMEAQFWLVKPSHSKLRLPSLPTKINCRQLPPLSALINLILCHLSSIISSLTSKSSLFLLLYSTHCLKWSSQCKAATLCTPYVKQQPYAKQQPYVDFLNDLEQNQVRETFFGVLLARMDITI